MKSYTNGEYERKAMEANNSGQMLYIIRKFSEESMPEGDNIDELYSEPFYIDSLDIAPLGYYVCSEGNITDGTLNPNYEQEAQQREQERINNLHVTPLDFLKMLMALGVTDEQIDVFLDSHIAIKHQLTFCNHVYCGVAKALAPFEIAGKTITAQQIEQLFIQALGTIENIQ